MTEINTAQSGNADDPRIEVLQAVYDRVLSYEESAPPEKIRQDLDDALAETELDLDDDARTRLVDYIHDRGDRESVASIL